MTRLLALLIAAAAFATAFLHPLFRSADGALNGRFVVPLAVGVAAAILGMTFRRNRLRSLSWLGLGLIGQAAMLQFVHAGPAIGYPLYLPWSSLFGEAQLPWTLIAIIQVAAATIGLRPHAPKMVAAFATHWPRARAAFVLLAFIVTGTTLTRNLTQSAGAFILAAIVQLAGLATFALAALDLPEDDVLALRLRFDRWFGREADAGGPAREGFWRLDGFVLGAAIFALLATALLSVLAYQRHPHVPDEVVYLIQAKYFAHGMLEMTLPPVPGAFDLDLMTYEANRWYSPVPPGWPAVLAIGMLAGVPWLVNPLLSAAAVVFAYVLLRDLYGLRTARIGVVLLCASPWFLFLGMSFMTHPLTLVVGLAGAACVAFLRKGGSTAWSIPAGLALGFLALIRPLEGALAALLFALWLLPRRPIGRTLVQIGVMAAASMAMAATTLPYNRHFTGSATTFPIMAYTDAQYGAGSNAIGFGANRGLPFGGLDPFPGHGALDVLVNTHFNLSLLSTQLSGWAAGSMLLLALALVSGRMRTPDRWMLAVVFAIAGGHAFYWFSGGPDFGARYWYLILVPCIALVLAGLRVIEAAIPREADRTRPLIAALLLTLGAVVAFVPWQAADKYHHYRGMQPGVRTLAQRTGFGRSLVLIRGQGHPDFASAAVYNPVDLHADAPIYAWDRDGFDRRPLLEAYRDRPVWIVDGPSQTGAGYRIVRGPVAADRLIAELNNGR